MSSAIIVENLSKKYILAHQRRERYTALRDVLANGAKRLGARILSPGKHGAASADSTHEEFWALQDVSFEIEQGDRVAIIGRNGAGKSTLLKVLSRITEPTAGRISITGRVASLLEVGTGFHPELTGRENIFLNGAILGMSKAEIRSKFDEIVAFAEVEKFLDTPVKRYSSGMYVRLAFAVAAHLEPEILVVDEVLAVGDAQFQKKCLGKMEERSNSGRTILFVSHNMSAVRALCNKAIQLKGGRVDYYGDVAEGVSRYLFEASSGGAVQRNWVAEGRIPQNSFAMLRSLVLCDEHDNVLQEITTSTPIRVRIEFGVKLDKAAVGFTLIVYDAEGTCVFSSISNRDATTYGKPLARGLYAAYCSIPGNFFNDGRYSLSIVMFGSNFSEATIEKDALGIEIHDSPEIRGDYHGGYEGCIRPALDWQTTQLE